jgi:gamma-glutamyltranspeptidase / glutathione hydrolase
MHKVVVATTSQLAADAASEVARAGGNAVDCALAAALVSINTQPGVCALAGGAYVTIWAPGEAPVTIDGNVAVPGKGKPPSRLGLGAVPVSMGYGGGITTLVGPGSVAVPGTPAALDASHRRFGSLPWALLFEPAIRAVRLGFPLPAACHYYLRYSGQAVFARSRDGFRALHDGDKLLPAGARIRIPHLADTLTQIATEGTACFYRGDLATAMAAHCEAGDGALGLDDLAAYEPLVRPALQLALADWSIATNPPPAVGGAMLAALLLGNAASAPDDVAALVGVQRRCLDFRRTRLDLADDVETAIDELLRPLREAQVTRRRPSASTVHTSAVDRNGLACAITASSGYGAGDMPDGTGLWLNNCLGELELNRRGLDAGPPGRRLPSNMAPTVARTATRTLAIGSPGADRITTALQQVLLNFMVRGMSLDRAIAQPRLHVDTSQDPYRLMAEPGIEIPETGLEVERTTGPNMYFGGVGAVLHAGEGNFTAAADPRREGAVGGA